MTNRCAAPSCRCEAPCLWWCGPQDEDGYPVYELEPDPEWVSIDLTQIYDPDYDYHDVVPEIL